MSSKQQVETNLEVLGTHLNSKSGTKGLGRDDECDLDVRSKDSARVVESGEIGKLKTGCT